VLALVAARAHSFFSPTSPPLRSPPSRLSSGGAAFLSPSGHRSSEAPSVQDVAASSYSAPRSVVSTSDCIPVFFSDQKRAEEVSAHSVSESALLQAFNSLSPPNMANFISMARDTLCLSSACAHLLFNKVRRNNDSGDPELADVDKLLKFWQAHRLCTPNQILFHLLVRDGRSSVTSSDFADIVRYVALTHPGLDFLKATPEFQDRYCECVIEQIIYFNTCDLSHALSQRDIANSDLALAFVALDEEDDINKFTKYFSYQHFYVLYCKVHLCCLGDDLLS
jgi:serine/threonine-protein phosphatase 2A regulatory subunit B''